MSTSAAGMFSVTRSRIRCTESTKPSRDALDQTNGATAGHVLLAQLPVAGERPRLQQRLELPALRPPLVVRDVRVEAAHERAVLALGAQVRVDLPERRFEGELGDPLHGVHGEPRGDLDGRPRTP